MNELNYQEVLASIASDKGLPELAKHIESFGFTPETSTPVNAVSPKYNITKMPEATCDGCQ